LKKSFTKNLHKAKTYVFARDNKKVYPYANIPLFFILYNNVKGQMAKEEIIARACEDILSMSEQGRKIFKSLSESEQKTLVDKIKAIINDLLNWVDELLHSYKATSKEAQIMREYKEELQKAKEVWDAMLEKSIETNQSLEKSGAFKHDGNTENVRYSLREEAISEVEQAISNKNYDKEIKLTDSSPAILISQKGVKNLPMMMVASHVRENILTEEEAKALGLTVNIHKHYHGLGKTLFLKVIDGLDNVTEAYRGTKNAEDTSRRENYFLLISQYKDSDGNTINVPVYINEKGRYNKIFIDTNKIATVFGRNELRNYIKNQIANGNLVRMKNKSTQASESTSLIDGDYSKNASNNSILNSDKNVKEMFSEKEINDDNTVYSEKDYSYETLVAKGNIEIAPLENVSSAEVSKYADRNIFIKDMKEIARNVGNPKNTEQKTYLYCKDLNQDILITRNSFKHGADRYDKTYISVCKSIDKILNNAIVVNELKARADTDGGYVLLSLAENSDSYVVVRAIVNKKTWKLEDYNELYAIRKRGIKKGDVGVKAPALHLISGYGTSPNISISNFLEFVNSSTLGNIVLPMDVVNHFNTSRTFDKDITPNLLFSEKEQSIYDTMGEANRVIKENKKLDDDVKRLAKVIDGTISNKTFLTLSKYIKKLSGSAIDTVELAKTLKEAIIKRGTLIPVEMTVMSLRCTSKTLRITLLMVSYHKTKK